MIWVEIWKVYFTQFFSVPFNVEMLLISWGVSLLCYIAFKRAENIKVKVAILYTHIIFLFLPFLFALFISKCWQCIVTVCDCSAKVMIYGTLGGGIGAIVLSFILLPYIYTWASKSREIKEGYLKEMVARHTARVPRLYLVHDLDPKAYSITNIRPSIFVSVGLCEILSEKEMEAVLLHELHHIQKKASLWKFSYQTLRIFSPLATFIPNANLKREELAADEFAVMKQGTARFLDAAKRKVQEMKEALS